MMTNGKLSSEQSPVADTRAIVTDYSIERLADAFRPYERHHFTLQGPDGSPVRFDRDLIRAGDVVGILPVDLARREVVLIKQFRLAAHVATGFGELVEIAAGRCDPGESARAAALRECHEEIGVHPKRATRIMTILVAPAFADELMSLWLAEVDATGVPELAGEEDEGEFIRPLRVPIADAGALVASGKVHSAPLVVALQWLAANADRLEDILQAANSAPA